MLLISWSTHSFYQRCQKLYPSQLKLNVVSAVPADGLAPCGARPSAGTVMTDKYCDLIFNVLCPYVGYRKFTIILFKKKNIDLGKASDNSMYYMYSYCLVECSGVVYVHLYYNYCTHFYINYSVPDQTVLIVCVAHDTWDT